jgi:hypothetical protein
VPAVAGASWCRLNGSQRDCPGSGTTLRLALREPTGPPSIPSDLVGAVGLEPTNPSLVSRMAVSAVPTLDNLPVS